MVPLDFPADLDNFPCVRVRVRVLVADMHRADPAPSAVVELQLVQRGDAVVGPDFPGIHRVIPEVLVGYPPVLVAQQPVAADHLRVEVHLDLGVLGDYLKGARQVVDEDAAGLAESIHVVVSPVAVVGQLFHQHVVEIAHSDAHGSQRYALIDGFFYPFQYCVGAGLPHVGNPIGKEDNAGDPVRVQFVLRHVICQPQPLLNEGRPSCAQLIDCPHDVRLVLSGCGLQQHRTA